MIWLEKFLNFIPDKKEIDPYFKTNESFPPEFLTFYL